MTKIGLLADTHHYLDEKVFQHFNDRDEIWHAGDFGTIALADALRAFRPLKGVYGNIDGYDVRSAYPKDLHWTCEGVNVYMIHIGGYPGRYAPGVADEIKRQSSALFIAGHSHILKIVYDKSLKCLHMNPGAAGNQGWHKVRTLVTFTIDGSDIRDCHIVELGTRATRLP